MRTLTPAVGLAAALALAAGCTAGDGPDDTATPAPRTIVVSAPEVVLAMSASGVADELRKVISDESGWRTLWTWAHALMEPEPPLPAVDFGESMLLVAAMGTRPTGGYAITIDSISEGTTLRAFVTTVSPGPGCISTQALTQPLQIVRVPRRDGRVEWVESRRVAPCG